MPITLGDITCDHLCEYCGDELCEQRFKDILSLIRYYRKENTVSKESNWSNEDVANMLQNRKKESDK